MAKFNRKHREWFKRALKPNVPALPHLKVRRPTGNRRRDPKSNARDDG